MFDFINIFPPHYRDCFHNTKLLKQHLQKEEFIHYVETLMYESQRTYFHDDRDSLSEFLLEYRETFLRALNNFEQKEVPLESYIGFLFKTYRKNFAKIQQQKQERNNKIYTHCSETTFDQTAVVDYQDHYGKDQLDSTVTESNNGVVVLPSLQQHQAKGRTLLDIAQKILEGQSSRAKKKLELYKVLRILLICNEIDIDKECLQLLLAQAQWQVAYYWGLIEKRELLLGQHRSKQNELNRKLQHSYLNYLKEERLFQKKQEQEEIDQQVMQQHRDELQRLYQILNSLRFRFLHMRHALTFQQVSELTSIPEAELKIYYRNLKNNTCDLESPQESSDFELE